MGLAAAGLTANEKPPFPGLDIGLRRFLELLLKILFYGELVEREFLYHVSPPTPLHPGYSLPNVHTLALKEDGFLGPVTLHKLQRFPPVPAQWAVVTVLLVQVALLCVVVPGFQLLQAFPARLTIGRTWG